LSSRRHAPLFLADGRGRPPGSCPSQDRPRPEPPEVADCRELNLAPGRSLRSRVAGLFLVVPLLARLGFDRLVTEAGYPGSEMVPASSAMLSLLALKLLDKERRSHIDDFNCDEALGLFAGLNILPKKSFATDYSYRTVRAQQLSLLQGWVKALAPVMFPEAEGFSLDFHPIPYRGDPAGLDRHYLPRRGKAGPSVLTFFALEQTSRCLCYANANLTRADQNGELMRFVEFWRGVTGSDPKWLYFDSKVIDYPELSRVNQRKGVIPKSGHAAGRLARLAAEACVISSVSASSAFNPAKQSGGVQRQLLPRSRAIASCVRATISSQRPDNTAARS
jgi:hypothetical protein